MMVMTRVKLYFSSFSRVEKKTRSEHMRERERKRQQTRAMVSLRVAPVVFCAPDFIQTRNVVVGGWVVISGLERY